MSTDNDFLTPPRPFNEHYDVPLSPPIRPPFAHYHSSSTLPPTPHTPYPPASPQPNNSTELKTTLKPYLSLPPRLLLITLTPALLPLLMTIAHLFQTRSSTAALAKQLKTSVLSACSGLATGAASLQTLPRYLAMQTNEEMIKATQASVLAVGEGLMDVITIVETVLNFMVDTYRSFLLCTIQFAVQGVLDVLIDAVQLISSGVTSSLNVIRTNIQNDVTAANDLIQNAVHGINKVTALVDVSLNVPNLTIPSLTSLQNVTIPTTFEDALLKLNSSLPSLTDLKTKLDAIIDTPFELLKTQINETRLEIAASFNSSILPVPSLQSLAATDANSLNAQLCSGLDTSLVDDTANALHKLATVAIGLMFFVLILIWVGLMLWEWKRWHALTGVIEEVEQEWKRDDALGKERDAWKTVAIVEHPILEKYGTRVLDRFAKRERTKTNIRWYLSYLAHPTCLSLLLISLLGLITLEFQLLALSSIKSHASATANSTVTASTENLTRTLNQATANSSIEYALEMNTAILKFENRIQEELFGTWLNTTAVVLNETLVEFYAEVESVLNTTFGNTILYNPINTFMYCILGSKITNLEQGLTWLYQHSKITLPTVSNDTLLLSNTSMNELISPITAAAVGSSSGNSGDGGLVGDLIDHFESALIVERNFYAIILGIWLGFAIIGLVVVAWNSGGRERYHAFRGISDQEDDTSKSKFWPWTKPTPIYDGYTEKDIPRIIEPSRQDSSFFDYKRDSKPVRPFVARKGTFQSTLSALAAPGQAFLRLAQSRSASRQDGRSSLIEPGHSSEKYNHHHQYHQQDDREDMQTPPPIWVDRFYGAIQGVKTGLWPSKGVKHGQAMDSSLNRNTSTRTQDTLDTENSFGASRLPTARTPREDWRHPSQPDFIPYSTGDAEGYYEDEERREEGDEMARKHNWTLVDSDTLPPAGASFRDDDSRYPVLGKYIATSSGSYPRPMSRATTINRNNSPPNRHDSIDYLDDQYDSHLQSEDGGMEGNNRQMEDRRKDQPLSPSSSNISSYFASEPHVEAVNRVQAGTAALAAVIKNLQDSQAEGRVDQ